MKKKYIILIFFFFTDTAISFTISVNNPIEVMMVTYQQTCFLISRSGHLCSTRELSLYQEKMPF